MDFSCFIRLKIRFLSDLSHRMNSTASTTVNIGVPIFCHADGTRSETIEKKFDHRQMDRLLPVIFMFVVSLSAVAVSKQEVIFIS